MGYLERSRYDEYFVIELFFAISTIFGLITVCIEQGNIDIDNKSLKKWIIYELIYLGIGSIIGLFFLVIYFASN
jgi:hypothetical protein